MASPHITVRSGISLLSLMLALICASVHAQKPERAVTRAVFTIEIRDAIGPATSDFFLKSLATAEQRDAQLLILQLDTPGGLETAMRDMIRGILSSSIPVAVYVSPSGARAASAGTYLLYASHIAAMAPATNLGAATPVQIGIASPPDRAKEDSKGSESADSGSAMEHKIVNDSVAYIRALAELRGRNVDWAESAVRTAASLSADAAREQNVIDVIATDVPDLLRQIDGRHLKTSTGVVVLATSGAPLQRIDADWRTQLLALLTNPNVAFLLMLAGVYGLVLEVSHPGALVPGIVGTICLLLALYAFQVLSVNYAGLALILLGAVLILAEAFVPAYGALGTGGIAAFVIGSIILWDSEVPGFRIARGLIAAVAFAASVVMLITVTYIARARRLPVVTGVEQLLQETAVALADFSQSGPVQIVGERWTAVTHVPVKQGQRLRVLRVRGLTLEVSPEE